MTVVSRRIISFCRKIFQRKKGIRLGMRQLRSGAQTVLFPFTLYRIFQQTRDLFAKNSGFRFVILCIIFFYVLHLYTKNIKSIYKYQKLNHIIFFIVIEYGNFF